MTKNKIKCMKIIVKEIDKLKSQMHKGRVVSEYLIYVMNDGIATSAFNVIGIEAKKEKINELLLIYMVDNNWKENKLDISSILEEISFEKFIS